MNLNETKAVFNSLNHVLINAYLVYKNKKVNNKKLMIFIDFLVVLDVLLLILKIL